MRDIQEDKSSFELTSKTGTSNYPAIQVVCPACATESHIERSGKWTCACGQKLDAELHKAEEMREHWRLALRPITAKRARAFLLHLANLTAVNSDDVAGAARLVNRFRGFFPLPFPDDSYLVREMREMSRGTETTADENRNMALQQLIACRNRLRHLWVTADREQRDWNMYLLRKYAYSLTAHPTVDTGAHWRMLDESPPPKDAFQQALLYFQLRVQLARICANPNCDVPYFFADRGNQQYCSDICSYSTRAEAKRQWWATKGEEWRKSKKKTSAYKTKEKRHGTGKTG